MFASKANYVRKEIHLGIIALVTLIAVPFLTVPEAFGQCGTPGNPDCGSSPNRIGGSELPPIIRAQTGSQSPGDQSPGDQSPSVVGINPAIGAKDITVETFASSPWFSLVTGCATLLGLLLALYQVQVRNIPPSVWRSLLWKKALLLSSGIGLFVLSAIQFYNHDTPPGGALFGIPYSLLHNNIFYPDYGEGGPLVWGILFIVGIAVFLIGLASNPLAKVREQLLVEQEKIEKVRAEALKEFLHGRPYRELSDIEKELYSDLVLYHRMVQSALVVMLTGYQDISSKFGSSPYITAAEKVNEIISLLDIATRSNKNNILNEDDGKMQG